MSTEPKKRISIVTPCYNEEGNVEELHALIKATMAQHPQYEYDHLFIDNASADRTVEILRRIAAEDSRVTVIVNTRNFGHIRSPYYALLQGRGDAVIILASDLQDPPELISQFLKKWEEGYKIVMGVKIASEETLTMWLVRKAYYWFISSVAEISLVKNATGFGLYDQRVIELLRTIDDPYPYFRGLVSELGFPPAVVPYKQAQRKRGITSNNFYTLYDLAMLGVTNHSKAPLRLATMAGFAFASLNALVAFGYLIAKLVWWNEFSLGVAPLVIGVFFMSSVQLFFVGIIGEYVGSIYTQVLKRPLVVEKERIHFGELP
jgi:glycosyltransferase involved in cell wall biosynthesis